MKDGLNGLIRFRLVAVEVFPKCTSLAEPFPAERGQVFQCGKVLAVKFFFGAWTETVEIGLQVNGG